LTSISGFPQNARTACEGTKSPRAPHLLLLTRFAREHSAHEMAEREFILSPSDSTHVKSSFPSPTGRGVSRQRCDGVRRGNPDTLCEPSLPRRARSNVNEHYAKARSGGPRPSGHPTRAQSPKPASLPDSHVKQPRRPLPGPSPTSSCHHEPAGQRQNDTYTEHNPHIQQRRPL